MQSKRLTYDGIHTSVCLLQRLECARVEKWDVRDDVGGTYLRQEYPKGTHNTYVRCFYVALIQIQPEQIDTYFGAHHQLVMLFGWCGAHQGLFDSLFYSDVCAFVYVCMYYSKILAGIRLLLHSVSVVLQYPHIEVCSGQQPSSM